jgi:hypothetical protein
MVINRQSYFRGFQGFSCPSEQLSLLRKTVAGSTTIPVRPQPLVEFGHANVIDRLKEAGGPRRAIVDSEGNRSCGCC